MSKQYFSQFFCECIVKDSWLDYLTKGEGNKCGEDAKGNILCCHLPGSILNHVNLEEDTGAQFLGYIAKVLDSKAGANFISIIFYDGRSAPFVQHNSQDADKFAIVIEIKRGLIQEADFFLPYDE